MTDEAIADQPVSDATFRRLRAVAPIIAEELGEPGIDRPSPGRLLHQLVAVVAKSGRADLAWLLTVALTATLPRPAEVAAIRRIFAAVPEEALFVAFLRESFDLAASHLLTDRDIELVVDGVVVDVDFCATHSHNTGIQRVVRQTMSRWASGRAMTLAAWNAEASVMRTISDSERRRVVAWSSETEQGRRVGRSDDPETFRLVVPFRSVVLLAEVPSADHLERLQAIAETSGNRVAAIGYDMIPIVSADTVPRAESERFARYLSVIKHVDLVVGISSTAAEEFAAFGTSLAAQGLRAFATDSVLLPVALPDRAQPRANREDVPVVLVVGSQEPRKNHDSILFAAETLWREGLRFNLRFIGGGDVRYTAPFDAKVRRANARGGSVEVLRGVGDQALLDSYASARFTVFPSLHEGYGLPAAESLAFGVPVITTGYGSTAEIAADGGCLRVDPRDDSQLVSAMRSLLTDDALLARLRSEILARPPRTWDDYANELWDAVVNPLREMARG